MFSDVAELWVSGLRAGYSEGHSGVLRTVDEKYDPLGVLCDVAYRHGGIDGWVRKHKCWLFDHQWFYLPQSVIDWAGLTFDEISDVVPLLEKVVEIFDNGGSFDDVADFVEQNVEGL